MNSDIRDHILEIITSAPADRSSWMSANTQGDGIQRRAFLKAQMHMDNFIANQANNAWLIMPGLRGIGKTTILSQLYNKAPASNNRKFFISLERIKLVGGTINDVIAIIEEVAGDKLDDIDEPVYIFLDEVQYLADWALGLKTVYDRTPKVFLACTGSSAIELQTNPDVARRSLKIPIHPLCFTEYVLIRQRTEGQARKLFPEPGLSKDIREALFESRNETEVLTRLQELRPRVSKYWKALPSRQDYIYDYIKFGTLPFTLRDPQEVVRWQKINALLNESLSRDVDATQKFDAPTRALFPRLLFLLASSDVVSFANLSSTLGLNEKTISSMVDTLVETEIIHPIPPRGTAYKKVSRPTKYLFTSPAMRAAICTSGGVLGDSRASVLRGHLIEDMVGMYIERIINPSETAGVVEYDYGQNGADLIVSKSGDKTESIAVEVGAMKRSASQCYETLGRTGGKYGLVVSGASLSIDSSKKSVFVPFEIFMLL